MCLSRSAQATGRVVGFAWRVRSGIRRAVVMKLEMMAAARHLSHGAGRTLADVHG